MTAQQFYAGQKVTATQMQSLARDITTVEKSADESVTSSTTYQDDDEITFPNLSAGTYWLNGSLFYTGSQSGDIHMHWTWPAGGGGYFSWTAVGLHDTWTDSVGGGRDAQIQAGCHNLSSPTDEAWFGVGTLFSRPVIWTGRLVLAVAGTLTLQWAQYTSNGTATTVQAGSYFTLEKIS